MKWQCASAAEQSPGQAPHEMTRADLHGGIDTKRHSLDISSQ
jgi:hypothetical protein